MIMKNNKNLEKKTMKQTIESASERVGLKIEQIQRLGLQVDSKSQTLREKLIQEIF